MLAVVAVGLLAGCSSGQPDSAQQAACQREASNDPHVRQLIAQSNPSATNNIFDKSFTTPQIRAQEAYRQAVLDCLRRRGLASPGGVEPVRRYPFSPLGF